MHGLQFMVVYDEKDASPQAHGHHLSITENAAVTRHKNLDYAVWVEFFHVLRSKKGLSFVLFSF